MSVLHWATVIAGLGAATTFAAEAPRAKPTAPPPGVQEITVRNTIDGAAEIDFITAQARLPERLVAETVDEPGRKRAVLFRRSAGPVRITLFDGAHESDFGPAIRWLAQQEKHLP